MSLKKRVSAPGCDDAPIVKIERGEATKPVTLIYPYYENPQFLIYQLRQWWAWPPAIRQFLSAIIIDDGSPNSPASTVLQYAAEPFPIRLYRIEVDVRWNWLAARNIGFQHARPGWCSVTDMDHVYPLDTLVTLITGIHDPETIYRYSRVEHSGEDIKPHPNSWFLTRDMFWRIGGHDEALSGHYGTDGEYRRRCVKTAPIRIMTDPLVRHEYIMDSSTTHYKRKQPEDKAVQKIIAARGKDWKPKKLSFPYREIHF